METQKSSPPSPQPLLPGQLEEIAALFKILGEPMRLIILQALCKEPQSVNDIVALANSTQANISKHLALLTTSGILQRKREGQRVFYSIKAPLVLKMCELVRANWLN